MPFSLRLGEHVKGGGQTRRLTRRGAANNLSACPGFRIFVVSPLEVGVIPEIVDEMFGIFEGTERFPSANEPCQFRATGQCPND